MWILTGQVLQLQLVFTPLGICGFFVALLSLEGRQSEISDKLHKVFEFFSPLLLSGLPIWRQDVFLLVLLKILEVAMHPPEYAGMSMCESDMLVGLQH